LYLNDALDYDFLFDLLKSFKAPNFRMKIPPLHYVRHHERLQAFKAGLLPIPTPVASVSPQPTPGLGPVPQPTAAESVSSPIILAPIAQVDPQPTLGAGSSAAQYELSNFGSQC